MAKHSKYLKRIRVRLGLTQSQMGKLLGVKRATVGGYEIGAINPGLDVYIKYQALDPDRKK